ncbi:hypothetical protein ADZZY_66 [Mycobacterium phage Adzzy]|nr:hypothetical protein ADZZY_66 [Mycobacterium phage Adzzy]AGT14314.1 hypothetical protein ADZZY_66 [Mycobacterium phage Adzzy]ATW60193.1 hypothetical protein SEA_PH8S_65 [Mycobacterium phage Ph8s]
MKISLKVLGFEIASAEIDLGETGPGDLTVADVAKKKLSRWWLRGAVK